MITLPKITISKFRGIGIILSGTGMVALLLLSKALFIRTIHQLESTYQAMDLTADLIETIREHTIDLERNAQLASYSGQLSWENQYFNHLEALEKELDILSATHSSNETLNLILDFREKNKNVVKIAEEVFKHVRAGDQKQAKAIQESIGLERARHVRSESLTKLAKTLETELEAEIEEARKIKRTAELSALVFQVFACLLFFWFWIENRMQHKALLNQNAALDRLVEERSAALIEQGKKAEEAQKMATLGVMAAEIAHEINNPLTILLGRISLLQRKASSDSPIETDTMNDSLKKMAEMTHRIAKIVRGLRSFARQGEADPKQEVRVDVLLQNTIELCKGHLKKFGVQYNERLDSDLTIEAREVQISQVLVNLIKNACEAIRDLPERWIRVEVKDEGERVEFSVTDSGPGITPDVAEKLMTPFFTTKGIGEGTGLGLSISKNIARDHGGDLKIDMDHPNTRFVLLIAKKENTQLKIAA